MNDVIKVIKSRRSIRSFLPDPIPECDLEAILEAGTYAPSGHNEQSWHFTVIRNREIIKYMSTKSKELMVRSDVDWIRRMGSIERLELTYKAPVLVIVSGRKDAPSWREDCCASIQNMLLAAESLGIGSIWLTLITLLFNDPGEAPKLGIPDIYQPYQGIALGFKNPAKLYPVPERKLNIINYID
ncbi:MAG TPA: nitroreductase [Clostridia bacterium]|nr:nitroreductase [Clostridia bacterium]